MPDVLLGAASELGPGATRYVELEGHRVLICNVAGEYFACAAECPHRGANLAQGRLEGHTVVCPWHEWEFDVRNGAGITNPMSSVAPYELRLENEQLILVVPNGDNKRDQ